MGCIAPGGVGTGLYGILLLAILAVFLAGLMVGRTPEYLGKRIEAREIKFAMLSLLLAPVLVLGFAAVSVEFEGRARQPRQRGAAWVERDPLCLCFDGCRQRFGVRRPRREHALVQHNDRDRHALGRIGGVVPDHGHRRVARPERKRSRASAGTFPTHGSLFVILLLAVVLIVTLLQFFPVITLGPLLENVLMESGRTF